MGSWIKPESSASRADKAQYLWQRMRTNFTLADYSSEPRVKKQIQWYVAHQKSLDKIAERAAPYLYYITTRLENRHMPVELSLIPVVESAFDPFSYNHSGAVGLWQIMPGTASGLGVKQDWWFDGRRDIYSSTRAALDYLSYLNDFFDGNWLLAIAAYDWGAGNVRYAVAKNKKQNFPLDFWALHVPRETAAYVPKWLALVSIIREPAKYGITLPAIPNQAYFAQVDVGSQIGISEAAKLASISLGEIHKLNPGYNRWATDPDGPYKLVLPIDKIDAFKVNLAKLPDGKRVTWRHYQVKNGDSLSVIAHRYNTKVNLLEEVNKISGTEIKAGYELLIPENTDYLPGYRISSAQKFVLSGKQMPGPRRVTHKVKSGDSLWKLAHEYNVRIPELQFWNQLKHRQALRPGQKLVIWIPPSNIARYNPYHQHHSKTVAVKSGDSLWKIAHANHVSIANLRHWNNYPKTLHPGQKLLLLRKTHS